VAAAKEVAPELRITEGAAASQLAKGAIEAAKSISPEAADLVEAALWE